MPIRLPAGLPARQVLLREGIEVSDDRRLADRSRPILRVALLNLMPRKAVTERQFARLLGGTAAHVDLTLFIPDSCRPKTAGSEHIEAFYKRWSEIRSRDFDALIVTGAPVETLEFEHVRYWHELRDIFDWARTGVRRSLYICWAGQAALHHFHGVPKHRLPRKLFGVFSHRAAAPDTALLRGLGEEFWVPVSRHTEVRAEDLPRRAGLEVLAESAESGLCLVADRSARADYMFNHLEYDTDTLRAEFLRDREAGGDIEPPRNYFPDDDPLGAPINRWRGTAERFFANWLETLESRPNRGGEVDTVMTWLVNGNRSLELVGDRFTDLLVTGVGRADRLPEVLWALADLGVTPRAVKARRTDDDGSWLLLRLDLQQEPAAQRICRNVLRLEGIVRIGYRCSDGSGGLLVDRGQAAHGSFHESAAVCPGRRTRSA